MSDDTTHTTTATLAQRALAAAENRPNPLSRLAAAAELEALARVLQREAAMDARNAGETWEAVGRATSRSKQGAQQRYSVSR